ncbi:MAG: MerR family transcriptional regulator [Candidatus Omnitrophota bacterium]
MKFDLITTKQTAKLLQVSVASINYYTNLGLFNVRDKKGNARLYDKNEILDVYGRMRRLMKEGYSLKLIKQKLEKDWRI